MADHALIRPFAIDDGQLDDLQKHECFVLGYELALIDSLIDLGEPFVRTVRADNRERITWKLDREERHHQWQWCPDDKSEEWIELTVEGSNI